MNTTMDLLNKALNEYGISATQWCKNLSVNRTALAVAKVRGRLSPTIAGNLARLLGEDIQKWVTIAALESEPDSYAKTKVIQTLKNFKKL